MLVKIVKNNEYFMTEDFKYWINLHKDQIFKVKEKCICNDGSTGYILYKVSFRISKNFIKIIAD